MSSALESRPCKRRFLHRLLILALVLVGVDQVYRLIYHIQVGHELRSLRNLGYLVPAADLGKSQRAVPDQENGALKILEAADYLSLPPDAFNPDQWPARAEEMGPAERDTFRQFLTNNASALAMLHAAARFKESQFHLDYSQGLEMRLSHLAKIKSLSQLLRAEAYLCTEEGQPEVAVKAINDGFSLARSLDHEPLLISQWIRMNCIATDCSSLERLLTQQALSQAQLASARSSRANSVWARFVSPPHSSGF